MINRTSQIFASKDNNGVVFNKCHPNIFVSYRYKRYRPIQSDTALMIN